MCSRHGNKWSIPEVLSLQREYELLKMNINEIASKHKRDTKAIAYKLYNEEFITKECLKKYLELIENEKMNARITNIESILDNITESDDLQNRMVHLEDNVKDISNAIRVILSERQSGSPNRSRSQVC